MPFLNINSDSSVTLAFKEMAAHPFMLIFTTRNVIVGTAVVICVPVALTVDRDPLSGLKKRGIVYLLHLTNLWNSLTLRKSSVHIHRCLRRIAPTHVVMNAILHRKNGEVGNECDTLVDALVLGDGRTERAAGIDDCD